MKIFFLFFLYCSLIIDVTAQDTYRSGLLPQVNVNHKINDRYSFNTKLESRHIFSEGKVNDNLTSKYRYERSDITFTLNRKIASNKGFALGYFIRLQDNKWIHRTLQQLTSINNYEGFRLAHRFLTDQTFQEKEPILWRFRYRLTTEISLQGQTIDAKEFYFKINNEVINNLQDKELDFEYRNLLALGYNMTDKNKLEAGTDYRISHFQTSVQRHQFWLYLGWFIGI